ncbi:RWD domain-containing protein 1 [Euwallacea similis]|uniref:RWD domain-containing protein 1 n=1 Tax=Euwallacea similis TaxID=1736056 RepID=UPI00344D10AE
MDYAEEQKGELEALESIYYGDFTVISNSPCKFAIPIKTDDHDPETNAGLSCDLVITYTPKYPEEPPIIEIDNAENFEQSFEIALLQHLDEQMKENLGMVMIFTLVSSAQEWLHNKYEEEKNAKEECEAQKLRELEEAERKRFEGTRVSIETFLKWRQQFEEEMGIDKKRELADKEGRKLTGRELFMTDNTLNESDLKFLDEGDRVKVDESLFQDMDDLDLDDDEDDEDFDPNNYHDYSS